jgi:mono/diheme cytochrome c family protein
MERPGNRARLAQSARSTGALALSLLMTTGVVSFTRAASPEQDTYTEAKSSFEEKVRPAIFKNCLGCHTSGGHAGGLTLDTFESALKGGDRGVAIIPGKPEASLLSKAVHYADDALKMPPRGKISDPDVAIIDNWILSHSVIGPPPAVSAATAGSKTVPELSTAPAAKTKTRTEAPSAAALQMAASGEITPEQEKFFEGTIRPFFAKNCYGCHTSPPSGGLRVDSREAILKGGKDGVVIVPGHPEESLLVRALKYNGKLQMPPKGPVSNDEVAAVERWIREGAPWPKKAAISASSRVTPAQREFWSFKPVVKPAVPQVDSPWITDKTGLAGEIDRFVLAKLKEKHLEPVRDADKRTLIRRVTYDLTGLPPTPHEVAAFSSDESPKAYEALVDRLLSSKAYGERWGRKWLDLVRYADTDGGSGDFPVPQASKYRDYVIQAFNDDKPFDRFIREQLAGDLLPAKSEPEHWQNIVATGYLAGAVRLEGRSAYLSDTVDNLGSAFLGVTVGCARCHDHKFDPIPTADYYSLYGFFASTSYPDSGTDGARYQRGIVYRDPETTSREDYKTFQAQLKPIQEATAAVMRLPGTYDDLVPQLQARRMHLFEHLPDFGESAYAVQEGTPQEARIHHYGDPQDLGDEAPRGFLQVLGGQPLPANSRGSGRLQLADWLASKDNPLTARVMVNRIWQGHFGRGIVATPNDFGMRGMAPANQALLDYLAATFVENGWSIKTLTREILLSHAYRLSSMSNVANEDVDPENAFIWHHSRVRMDAEEIRDTLLADSQLLDTSPVQPHPFPPQSVWNYEQQNMFSPNPKDYETGRRTVYTMIQRTVRSPYFNLFDGPNVNASTDQRGASLTPLQALYFMNDPFPKRCAANLAAKLMAGGTTEKQNIDKAFLTIYGRPADPSEADRAASFLHTAAQVHKAHDVGTPSPRQKALEDFLKAMFASNEFMFIE